MDPSYETVVDPSTIVWTLAAMLIHGAMMAMQIGLIVYLIASGLLAWLAPESDGPWLRRLGVLPPSTQSARTFALARTGLGIALCTPVALGAPFSLTLAASLAAFALLMSQERGLLASARRTGRFVRRLSVVVAALVAAFTVCSALVFYFRSLKKRYMLVFK